MKLPHVLLVAAILGACDSDPSAPDIDARGNYLLTELTFDPQGSLPQIDLRARTTVTVPRLVLVTGGRAQLVFEDPGTGLVTTADASYSITNSGDIRVDFDEGASLFRGSFLSRRMTFVYDAAERALTFSGASPDGIDRSRLLALVPEWNTEQLFDPVPGTLRVVYRAGTAQ